MRTSPSHLSQSVYLTQYPERRGELERWIFVVCCCIAAAQVPDDAGGVPGALIGAETLIPSSQSVVGSNFGFNVSEVLLDISPVNFTEGTYWIGTSVVSSTGGLTAWETTSASAIGAGSVTSEDEGVSWRISNRGDGVFTLSGICSD